MTTTATQNFDKTIKSLKVTGTLHAEKLKVGSGWKTFVPTIGGGGVVGTGANLVVNEWRYMIENNTVYVQGNIQKGAATTSNATGSGTYTFTLPTGCSARAPAGNTAITSYCVGTAFQAGATKLATGVVNLDPATNTITIVCGSDTLLPAVWSSSSDAEFRLGVAGALTVGISYRVELLETSTILSGVNP